MAHLPPAIVLYGSQTGTAESIARRVRADAEAAGHVATIAPMNDFKKVASSFAFTHKN
jgi:flavodoxin